MLISNMTDRIIHDVFHSKLLRFVINDSLSDQKNEFSRSIVINNEDE